MKITPEIRRRAAAYPKSVRWSDEDGVFIGSIEGLCGDCDHGSDPVVVFRTLKRLAEETIAQWDAAGLPLPDAPSPTPLEVPPIKIRGAMSISQTPFAFGKREFFDRSWETAGRPQWAFDACDSTWNRYTHPSPGKPLTGQVFPNQTHLVGPLDITSGDAANERC